MLVAKTKTPKNFLNLRVPPPLVERFEALVVHLGLSDKEKWAVLSAAVFKLLTIPEAEQRQLIGDILAIRADPKRLLSALDEQNGQGKHP